MDRGDAFFRHHCLKLSSAFRELVTCTCNEITLNMMKRMHIKHRKNTKNRFIMIGQIFVALRTMDPECQSNSDMIAPMNRSGYRKTERRVNSIILVQTKMDFGRSIICVVFLIVCRSALISLDGLMRFYLGWWH